MGPSQEGEAERARLVLPPPHFVCITSTAVTPYPCYMPPGPPRSCLFALCTNGGVSSPMLLPPLLDRYIRISFSSRS